MSNALINLNKTGPCRTPACGGTGKRARGARDIEDIAKKTGVFEVPSYYCQVCLGSAAQRSLLK
jgi:hypothetical protein